MLNKRVAMAYAVPTDPGTTWIDWKGWPYALGDAGTVVHERSDGDECLVRFDNQAVTWLPVGCLRILH